MPRLDATLEAGREGGASDVHLTPGRPPLFRIDGELAEAHLPALSADEIAAFVDEMLDGEQRATLDRKRSVDLAHVMNGMRYRINVCHQTRGPLLVARVVPDRIFPLHRLGLPRVLNSVTELKDGLVLVTGATGTGKSTTLAALIDQINRTRYTTILTLEDPIEFVHTSDTSLVVQREVGIHVESYAEGLRSALRQDPDVILVGELRDQESIRLALEAAETGHLVFGTLHTRGAAHTLDRILDAFPPDEHQQIRVTLADNLRCVISQELVRTADGRGRCPALEIMVGNKAIAQLIREGETFKIPGVIMTHRRLGMQLMDHSLLTLVQAGDIDPDEAFRLASSKKEFVPFVQHPDPSMLLAAGGER